MCVLSYWLITVYTGALRIFLQKNFLLLGSGQREASRATLPGSRPADETEEEAAERRDREAIEQAEAEEMDLAHPTTSRQPDQDDDVFAPPPSQRARTDHDNASQVRGSGRGRAARGGATRGERGGGAPANNNQSTSTSASTRRYATRAGSPIPTTSTGGGGRGGLPPILQLRSTRRR